MRITLLCTLAVLFVLVAVHANAAGDRTGRVTGVVVEPNGKPAPGAEVLMERSNGSAPVAARTNSSGRFLFKYVLSGLYDIRASRGASATVWKHNVMVRRGKETEIELRLEPILSKSK